MTRLDYRIKQLIRSLTIENVVLGLLSFTILHLLFIPILFVLGKVVAFMWNNSIFIAVQGVSDINYKIGAYLILFVSTLLLPTAGFIVLTLKSINKVK